MGDSVRSQEPATLMSLERCPFCGTDQIEDVVLDDGEPGVSPRIGQTWCLNCGARGPVTGADFHGGFCHPFTWLPQPDWERIHDTEVHPQRLEVFAGRRSI